MRQVMSVLVVSGLVALAGCGGGGGTLPVSGIVTLDAQPLPNATITFYPESEVVGVVGGVAKTGSDGKFVVTNAKGDSGLVPGKYKVTVSKGVLRTESGEESVGAVIEEIDLKDELPPIYSSPTKTILSYSVTGDGQPIEIKLDSKKKR